MDPDNLFRGPRRAHRRGEPPLRIGRMADPAMLTPETLDMDFQDQTTPNRSVNDDPDNDRGSLLRQHMQEMLWARQQQQQQSADDSDLAQETSASGEDDDDDDDDNNNVSDSDELPEQYGELADEDLLDDDQGYELGSQQEDMPTEEYFDPAALGLKEINNLAHFSVSSHKPGNGVDELLNDDLDKYWQSDGPQPHFLTIHFLRRVEIRAIRFYVDYSQDESYTPTLVVLSAGTGHHDLIEFATMPLVSPIGWQDVDLSNAGGGEDGQSLCCWIVQIKVRENHQNGKDTHIRGIKIYAIDENAPPVVDDELSKLKEKALRDVSEEPAAGDYYLFERMLSQAIPAAAPDRQGTIAEFMRDEEIR